MPTIPNDPYGYITKSLFYTLNKRRRSGRSNTKFHHKHYNSGMLGGDALMQGTEIQDIHMSRGLLPIIGRGDRYRHVIEYRDENRNVVAIEDSRENHYFTDNSKLSRTRFTMTNNVQDNTAKVQFPDGGIRQIPEFYLDLETYGEGREFNIHTPYHDLMRYEPVEYVRSSGPLGMFPITTNSPSYTAEMVYNGIIEPFDIRSILYQRNTFMPDDPYPGKVFGFAPDLIEFVIPISDRTRPAGGWYEDATSNVVEKQFDADGNVIGVDGVEQWQESPSVKQFEAEYITETNFHLDPHLDRDSYTSVFVDDEMESVLFSMDATLDEGTLPYQYIDSTVGFDAPARQRIDSSVYRDLLR